MDSKEFLAAVEANRLAEKAKPWYVRAPKTTAEFIVYRIIYRAKDWPQEFKWWYQRVTRGYDDTDVWNLNDYILRKIYPPFVKFIRYAEEEGKSLPLEFGSDPAAWLVVLSKIEYALKHSYAENINGDLDFYGTLTLEQKAEHYKKVEEGLTLLGKYLLDLWD